MNIQFFKYFLGYIFKTKTRQRLLLIAVVGLLISSFSLVVLQGVMGGLQNGLINRSKLALGHGYFDLIKHQDKETYRDIVDKLQVAKIDFYPEYEIELMLKKENRLSPLILHGIDYKFGIPPFLNKRDTSETVLGSDVANKVNAYFESKLNFISPAHVDTLFGDVPRQVTSKVSDFYMSELQEIDAVHGWVRLGVVQNLIRKRSINKIVFYDEENLESATKIIEKFYPQIGIVTWEKMNRSLVWALALETNVMVFLFVGMSFLVAICITSGFMIFFDKIKGDLISFWILGKSQKEIFKLSYLLTHAVSIIFTGIGLLAGLAFLFLLQNNDINFMPDFFVERRIPVKLDSFKIIISFVIPYIISVVFSYFSFSIFKKESSSFLNVIRNAG